MAYLLKMGTLHRKHARLGIVIRIPGGWTVRVSSHEAEPWLYEGYTRYFISCGVEIGKAMLIAKRTVEQYCVHGYADGLREAISRRAMEYAEMWPQHIVDTGERKGKLRIVTLRGFDAAKVQQMYVPGQNMGRAGQDYVKEMLADMGREIHNG